MLAEKPNNENSPKISFPKSATIGEVESSFKEFFSEHETSVDYLELDMSSCKFVEVATLMHIIALLKDRVLRRLETKIRLPHSKDVRDFFRVWEFPKAVHETTGKPFAYFVFEDDFKGYFGENQQGGSLKYANWIYLDSAVQRLLSDRFFAFISFYPVEIGADSRLAVDVSKRWQQPLIESVLKKLMVNRPQGQISSRIVYESIANAERHPCASIILTASILTQASTKNGDVRRHLTVVVWDDGASMVDTLKNTIVAGKPIIYSSVCDFDSSFILVRENDEGEELPSEVIGASFIPDISCDDQQIFLSTLLPGISCDITGVGWDVHPDLKTEKPDWVSPGMGLAVLINSVVEAFGGSVAFRTKNLFMNVSKNKQKEKTEKIPRYRAKVRLCDEVLPEFLGNMLTIRIPLQQS